MSRLRNTTIAAGLVTALLSGVQALADFQEDLEKNATGVQEVSAAQPDCDGSWRAARLQCAGNSTGIAAGNYGGTDFFLNCSGESSVRFCTSGNAFRYIMEGQDSDGRAVRCALSGSAGQVNEKCGPLHLIIN
jgi:hypothetical protein